MDNNILSAFLLTLSAGFATGIGSIIALFAKKTNKKFLHTINKFLQKPNRL